MHSENDWLHVHIKLILQLYSEYFMNRILPTNKYVVCSISILFRNKLKFCHFLGYAAQNGKTTSVFIFQKYEIFLSISLLKLSKQFKWSITYTFPKRSTGIILNNIFLTFFEFIAPIWRTMQFKFKRIAKSILCHKMHKNWTIISMVFLKRVLHKIVKLLIRRSKIKKNRVHYIQKKRKKL